MRPLLVGLVLVAVLVAAFAGLVLGGAAWLHGQGRLDDEIGWLETFEPAMGWDAGYQVRIERAYRDRVRKALDDDRLDRAVAALRLAWRRGLVPRENRELMALGIETFTRAADRLEGHGRLSGAADWDDSLFVLAIRAPEPHHRYAAIAAFMEGLDLRVRAGQPCEALARVRWARRGLGGIVPGLPPAVEEDLELQCRRSRGRRR